MHTQNDLDPEPLFQPSLHHAPAKITRLSKEVMQRTPSQAALSLYPAALLYQLPCWEIPQEINVVYFRQRTFSKTCVGRDQFGNGVTVRRYFRDFPPAAITIIDNQPVLNLEWLLLDFLLLPNPRAAFTTANAIFRRLVQATRENPQDQQLRTLKWRSYLAELARQHISAYYLPRILRRLELLNPLAESPLETVLEVTFRQLGYRSYRAQAPIRVPQTTFFADGFLPRLKLVIEADGDLKRRADPALVRQIWREKLIKTAGYQVIRFTSNECWDPDLPRRICTKLGARPPRYLRKI